MAGFDVHVQERVRRLQRAIDFTAPLVNRMRAEFAGAWSEASDPEGLPGPVRVSLMALVAQVDALRAALEQGRAAVQSAQLLPPAKAHALLDRTDARVLSDLAGGLEDRARALRGQLGLRTGVPLAPVARATRPLTGLLSRWLDRTETRPWQPPAPPPEDPEVTRRRDALAAVLTMGQEILAYMGSRIKLIGTVARVIGLPAKPPPMVVIEHTMPQAAEEAAVPPGQREWLVPLARLFIEQPRVGRDAQVAVVQFHQAKQRVGEAEVFQEKVAVASPVNRRLLLDAVDQGRLRASLQALNNMHVTFRDVPLMRDLFPPPRRR